ncbi:MAG: TAXI family TRAP transporter solute-binding subunit, partial [Alphaproteobacteria bacterium]|nr:TAXI family TRAP transporter solute-binding subunit [Alphaproteobacteria bacterium]
MHRRSFAAALAAGAVSPSLVVPARAQAAALSFGTAGPGSAFLPYGQGIAKAIEAAGAARIAIRQTGGSNDNLDLVDGEPTTIGCSFLGSAYDALNGTGFARDKPHRNVRALFPMYETAFMAAALRSKTLTSLKALDGRKVGCGPVPGPAAGYFQAAAEIAGIKPLVLGGTPADQGKALLAGELDAFWQGASVPIPSLVAVVNAADCVVFGLAPDEAAAMRKRFPYMSDFSAPAGTYRGQTAPLRSVAAWNVVIAHKDLPDATAYAITKVVLSSTNLVADAGAAAASTKAAN